LQYFEKKGLLSSDEESITVLKTGLLNSNAGPDFFNAKIKIGEIEWVGNVEIHIKSSDWFAHHHEKDSAYDNVILHVVWDDDKPVLRNGISIPTLELKNRVDSSLLHEYKKLINSSTSIACQKSLPHVEELVKLSM